MSRETEAPRPEAQGGPQPGSPLEPGVRDPQASAPHLPPLPAPPAPPGPPRRRTGTERWSERETVRIGKPAGWRGSGRGRRRSERQRHRRETTGSGEAARRDGTRGRGGDTAPQTRGQRLSSGAVKPRAAATPRPGRGPGRPAARRGGPGSRRRPAAPETPEPGRRRGRPPLPPGPPRSRRALPPRGPTWLRRPGPRPRPRPAPSRPARAPAPHLVEGEELLLELLALRVRALPPEPKLHHLASLRRAAPAAAAAARRMRRTAPRVLRRRRGARRCARPPGSGVRGGAFAGMGPGRE